MTIQDNQAKIHTKPKQALEIVDFSFLVCYLIEK